MAAAARDAIWTFGVQLEPGQRKTRLPVALVPAGLVQARSISVGETAVADVSVGGNGGGVLEQLLNLNEAIRVCQSALALTYSFVYQKVQSSLGSMRKAV